MSTIKDVLQRKGDQVHTVGPDDSVLEALRLMAEADVGALVVVEGGKVVGMFSERDYARKIILKGHSSADTKVREIMSSPVLYIEPRETIEEGMALMTERQVRHLPVLDGDSLLGIVSLRDLAKEHIANKEFIIEQLEHYIRGGASIG